MSIAKISKNKLVFEGTEKANFSPFFRQKKFELSLSDIKIIGAKFGMFFDDDYSIIILISRENKRYFMPYEYLEEETVKQLNNTFDIDLYRSFEGHLDFEIETFKSKILFPHEKVNQGIFKEKNIITALYLFFGKLFLIVHYADGILTREVRRYSAGELK